MITKAEATEARNELAEKLGITYAPRPDVVGIGIAREDGDYVVEVDVTHEDIELPKDVHGVPVRSVVSAVPHAY
jgi:hypothetical protein